MLFISKQGHVDAERVIVKIYPSIERGPMEHVNGIVVHQTGASTASSTFNSYRNTAHVPNGAHFLIDKDGTIYQTASLNRITNHVGKLQSRCITTLQCSTADLRAARQAYRASPAAFHRHEFGKRFLIATRPTRTRSESSLSACTTPTRKLRNRSMKASRPNKMPLSNGWFANCPRH